MKQAQTGQIGTVRPSQNTRGSHFWENFGVPVRVPGLYSSFKIDEKICIWTVPTMVQNQNSLVVRNFLDNKFDWQRWDWEPNERKRVKNHWETVFS